MPIYFKIEFKNKSGSIISGDASEGSHLAWIQALTMNFGISRNVEFIPYNQNTSNRRVTHPTNGAINLTKKTCCASPFLMNLACKTETLNITIDITASAPNEMLPSAVATHLPEQVITTQVMHLYKIKVQILLI